MSKKLIANIGIASLLIPYLLVSTVLLGLSVLKGYFLRWMFKIDFGIAILIGLVTTSITVYFVTRLLSSILVPVSTELDEDDEEDDEEDDDKNYKPRRSTYTQKSGRAIRKQIIGTNS